MSPEQEMSDEEAILKIAQAMKDNAPSQDEKQNVHSFLFNVIETEGVGKVSKIGNLIQTKEIDELGIPTWNVRGSLEMARISRMIMENNFFQDYFNEGARETLNTSLSRDGFIIRQGTTQTKQVADITRRRKINQGWFGKKNIEESGGDTTTQNKEN